MAQTQTPPQVRVARFTESRLVPLEHTEGMTVGDALRMAEMQPEGNEIIMVNGQAATADTPLSAEDTVTLANKPAFGR